MNNELLQFNSHIHLFQRENISAIFDAISFDVVYMDPQMAQLFHTFSKPISRKKFLADIHSPLRIKATSILEQLIALGIIGPLTDPQKDRLSFHKLNLEPQPIRVLDIIPAFSCNLSCTYCYQRSATLPGHKWHNCFLDVERGEAIATAFLEQTGSGRDQNSQHLELVFIGGEPLVHPELLFRLIPLARRHRNGDKENLKIVVVTNGTLVDTEICNLFVQNNVFAIVSIDGFQESHDTARPYCDGRGSYKDTLRGYKLLQTHGCDVGISAVIGNHNLETFVDDISKMLFALEPQDISINSCLHNDLDYPNPNRVPSDLFAEYAKKLYQHLIVMGKMPTQLLRRFEPFLTQKPNYYFCPSFVDKMVVSPDGKVGPCEGFAYLGEHMFNWESFFSKKYDERRKWNCFSPIFNKTCYQCPLILMCGGGCRYDASTIYGSIHNLDVYRCTQEKIIFEWFLLELLTEMCDINLNNGTVIMTTKMRKSILNELKGDDADIAWR